MCKVKKNVKNKKIKRYIFPFFHHFIILYTDSQTAEKTSTLIQCGSTSNTSNKFDAIVTSPSEEPQKTQHSEGNTASSTFQKI